MAIVVSVVTVGLGAIHALAGWWVGTWLRRARRPGKPDVPVPTGKVAVLVAVRGWDPSLAALIDALGRQTTIDYEVHLILDGFEREDMRRLEGCLDRQPRSSPFFVHKLSNPPRTCGLKCAALNQGLQAVSPDCVYVAFVDADIVPPCHWLSDLIRPLADPTIGLTTAVQWFEPPDQGWRPGSWARALWNGAAIVPTLLAGNVWAGSMACRIRDLKRAGVPELWQQSMVDDGPLKSAFAKIGLRVHVCRNLIMINRESCTLKFTANYMVRTLTWSRLYEPSFWTAIAAGGIAALLCVAWLVMALEPISSGQFGRWGLLAVAVLTASIGSWWGFQSMRLAVLNADQRGLWDRATESRFSILSGLKQIWLIPVLHGIFAWAVWRAATARRIKWRGVRYQIDGPFSIERLDHPAPLAHMTAARQSVD